MNTLEPNQIPAEAKTSDQVRFYEMRNTMGAPVAVVAYRRARTSIAPRDSVVEYTVTKCHYSDLYDKKRGQRIAAERLNSVDLRFAAGKLPEETQIVAVMRNIAGAQQKHSPAERAAARRFLKEAEARKPFFNSENLGMEPLLALYKTAVERAATREGKEKTFYVKQAKRLEAEIQKCATGLTVPNTVSRSANVLAFMGVGNPITTNHTDDIPF